MKTYKFEWAGKKKFVEGASEADAMIKFQHRFGFWPDKDHVRITYSPVGVVQ